LKFSRRIAAWGKPGCLSLGFLENKSKLKKKGTIPNMNTKNQNYLNIFFYPEYSSSARKNNIKHKFLVATPPPPGKTPGGAHGLQSSAT
jgi:hypothetical protein